MYKSLQILSNSYEDLTLTYNHNKKKIGVNPFLKQFFGGQLGNLVIEIFIQNTIFYDDFKFFLKKKQIYNLFRILD